MSPYHTYAQGESGEAATDEGVSKPAGVQNAQTLYSEDWSLIDEPPKLASTITKAETRQHVASTPAARDMSGFSDSMHPGEGNDIRKAARLLQKQCHRTLPLREAAISLHSKADFDYQNSQHIMDRVSTLQKELLDRLSAIVEPAVISEVHALYESVRADCAALDEQMQQVRETQQAASRLHLALTARDTKIHRSYSRLSKVLDGLTPDNDVAMTDTTDFTDQEAVTDRTEERQTLARYNRAVADRRIMWERLQSVKFDYHEELVVRGFRQDREEYLSLTDAEFEAAYVKELAAAQEAYEHSVTNADNARQACLDDGIALEDDQPTEDIVALPQVGHYEQTLPMVALDDAPLPFAMRPHIDEYVPSPPCLSATTGAMFSGDLRLKTSNTEKALKTAAVAHWLQNTSSEHDQDEAMSSSQQSCAETSTSPAARAAEVGEDQAAVLNAMQQTSSIEGHARVTWEASPISDPTHGQVPDEQDLQSGMPAFEKHALSSKLPTRRYTDSSPTIQLSRSEGRVNHLPHIHVGLLRPPARRSSDPSLVHRCRHDSAQDIYDPQKQPAAEGRLED